MMNKEQAERNLAALEEKAGELQKEIEKQREALEDPKLSLSVGGAYVASITLNGKVLPRLLLSTGKEYMVLGGDNDYVFPNGDFQKIVYGGIYNLHMKLDGLTILKDPCLSNAIRLFLENQ